MSTPFQLAFPSTVGEVGDPLDRHYTPLPLARVIVAALDEILDDTPRFIVEPSAGSGSFLAAAREVWPDAFMLAVDIDPGSSAREHADRFVNRDWLEVSREIRDVDLILGNPPFKGTTGIAHVEQCVRTHPAAVVSLILPWSFLGGVERWSHLMAGANRPEMAWPITPRPWGDKVRETANFVWREPVDATLVQSMPRWR